MMSPLIPSSHILYYTISVFITVFLLVCPLPLSFCSHYQPHPNTPFSSRGLFFEDESRLGSTPPSCHNKCNRCHPCMAVQVPSLYKPRSAQTDSMRPTGFFDPSSQGNTYTNYKPLGWKCHCGNHFFNP